MQGLVPDVEHPDPQNWGVILLGTCWFQGWRHDFRRLVGVTPKVGLQLVTSWPLLPLAVFFNLNMLSHSRNLLGSINDLSCKDFADSA